MASLLVPSGGAAFRLQPRPSASSSPLARRAGSSPNGRGPAFGRAARLSASRLCCNAQSGPQDDRPPAGPSSAGAESPPSGVSAVAAATAASEDESRAPSPVEAIRKGAGQFWRTMKERHVIYRQDREQWGLGLDPIFVVHEDARGNPYRVDVNEDEILLRSGAVGLKNSRFPDEEGNALAEQRIEAARRHAEEIRLGLVTPSPLSVLYRYQRENSANAGDGALPWTAPDAPPIAPLQFVSLLAVLLAAAAVTVGVKRLLSKKTPEEDPEAEKRRRLMRMRKLRAQARRVASEREVTDGNHEQALLGADVGSLDEERVPLAREEEEEAEQEEAQEPDEVVMNVAEGRHPRLNDQEFRRKVTQIRAMARKVRLQEQENAEISAREQEALEEELSNEQSRARRLKRLAEDLDTVRRSGAKDSDGVDFGEEELSEERRAAGMENSYPSTSSKAGANGSNSPGEKERLVQPLRSGLGRRNAKSAGQKPPGVRPRIILSAEEARARIAAKRAKLNGSPSSSLSSGAEASCLPSATQGRGSEDSPPDSQEARSLQSDGALPSRPSESGASGGDVRLQAGDVPPEQNFKTVGTNRKEPMKDAQSLSYDEGSGDRTSNVGDPQTGQKKLKDEEEEMEWMRDEVLREIVFKVQANEEAGREPFHNLNSEQETLFFKGLERKFEREGDKVKKWIQDRVENIDYGLDGISVFDPPESFELKWKEGYERPSKSEFVNRFNEDRKKIIMEAQGNTHTSPRDLEDLDMEEDSSPLSSSSSPTSPASSSSSPPIPKSNEPAPGRTREVFSGDGETKTVISSSGGADQRSGSPHQSTSPSTDNSEKGTENWNHTKRWAKDLERKYAMESDPATKAVMRELGQDLDRWITEDEIEEASRLLDKGPEGEEEYVKMHYERTKEKIKRQREMFGPEAMVSKYSEYKDEGEETELWWLGLPFVVCIGLQATMEGERETGLYSVDVGGALEGVQGVPSEAYHTVAFEDRGDAQNFCALINRQPEKLDAEGAKIVPFDPKVLYSDAKSEGFKVTVIKKGQLQLSVDKSFEEVENNIVELGSATYFNEMIKNRVVDMDAAVDEGLGFGRRP